MSCETSAVFAARGQEGTDWKAHPTRAGGFDEGPINYYTVAHELSRVSATIHRWSAADVGPEGRDRYLSAYTERLIPVETTPAVPFHPLADYDETRQLKPGR